MSRSTRLLNLLQEYESAERKHTFFSDKYKWLMDCPYNVDEEKKQAKEDVKEWRDISFQRRNDLVKAIKKCK